MWAQLRSTLYTDVTNNLEGGVLEHRRKLVPGFTTRYNINRLVYYETLGEVSDRHPSREADQGLAAYKEGCFSRVCSSRLEGPERRVVRKRPLEDRPPSPTCSRCFLLGEPY